MTNAAPEQLSESGIKLPVFTCPTCSYVADCATCATDNSRPQPGDFTLCLKCGEILVFDPDFTTRTPTLTELNNAQKDADFWRTLCKGQRIIRANRYIP